MKFWVNKNSETDNFVILAKDSLIVASCDEENLGTSEKKLSQGDSPSIVFGTDNFTTITFSQVLKMVARSTDAEVDIDYKVKKEEENKLICFENIEGAQNFTAAIEKRLPERLKKKEFQQSILSAGFPPLLSLITALGITAMFINKFRWLALIIGGVWALASLYKLFTRVTRPPLITQWSSRNAVGAAWSQIKTAGSLMLVAVIVLAFSSRFPDSYGEQSFVQHMDHGELEARYVTKLLENGGDINLLDKYGSRPLHYAAYNEDFELFKALLDNGADPSLEDDQGEDALDEAVYQDQSQMTGYLLGQYSGQVSLKGKLNSYLGDSISASMISQLLANGVDPTETDENGYNALQVALSNSADYEVVSILLENKVPSNVQLDGLSLKQFALENGQGDVARLFDDGGLSFEQERLLTEKIDAFYADRVRQQLSKMSGVAKLLVGNIDDDETKELAQELSRSMQYKSLSAVGNQRILSAYAEGCEKSGFENAEAFKNRQAERARKLSGHSGVAKLIIERNRSIYNEAKSEFVTPSEFQAKVERSIKGVEKRYSNATEEGADVSALNAKCADVYKKVAARTK